MDVKNALFDELDVSDLLAGNKQARRVLGRDGAYDMMQYRHWRTHLANLYVTSIRWYGLPAGIEPRTVEYVLAVYGMGGLFESDGGFLFSQTSPGSRLNINYSPNRVTITSPAGDSWQRNALAWVDDSGEVRLPNCVLCFDSTMRRPAMQDIEYYAKRLATIDRVADVNISAQLTPWVIAGGEAQEGNTKRIINKLRENAQYLTVNDAYAGAAPTVLSTAAPFVADKLQEYKTNLIAEYLGSIGVDNDPNADKRAQRSTAEIAQNNEQVMIARNARLEPRREFCRRAHDVFNLDIWCEWAAPHIEAESSATEYVRGTREDEDDGQ